MAARKKKTKKPDGSESVKWLKERVTHWEEKLKYCQNEIAREEEQLVCIEKSLEVGRINRQCMAAQIADMEAAIDILEG